MLTNRTSTKLHKGNTVVLSRLVCPLVMSQQLKGGPGEGGAEGGPGEGGAEGKDLSGDRFVKGVGSQRSSKGGEFGGWNEGRGWTTEGSKLTASLHDHSPCQFVRKEEWGLAGKGGRFGW